MADAVSRLPWRQFSLATHDVLPFLDGVFAVAFTLLSASLPEELRGGQAGVADLLLALACSVLSGAATLLYWFKMRRLVRMVRRLHLWPLLLGFVSLLTIVALPKLAALALRYGQGQGDLFHWTPSQSANVVFLGALFLFDGLVLLLAISLYLTVRQEAGPVQALTAALESQAIGFVLLLLLGLLELSCDWFNNQYMLLVPLVLLLEEVLVARRFSRC